MRYNNRLKMQDLFMNPALAGIFPQFKRGEKLQNVYSFAETEKRVAEYLAGALNGSITGDGEITVPGKHRDVLNRVLRLKGLIESFFNNTPKVVAALRRNTPLYLPYATVAQLKRLHTPESKIKAMREVMDNFQYNTDLGSLNTVSRESGEQFARHKREWEEKVGYGRLKKI